MLKWELLSCEYKINPHRTITSGKDNELDAPWMYRSKVPGGWLIMMFEHKVDTGYLEKEDLRYWNEEHGWLDYETRGSYGWGVGLSGVTFVPDPMHRWDGDSLD